MVVPPGVTTLSIHIFGLLHYGVEYQVAGICLALMGMFAVVAAAVWGIMKGITNATFIDDQKTNVASTV